MVLTIIWFYVIEIGKNNAAKKKTFDDLYLQLRWKVEFAVVNSHSFKELERLFEEARNMEDVNFERLDVLHNEFLIKFQNEGVTGK